MEKKALAGTMYACTLGKRANYMYVNPSRPAEVKRSLISRREGAEQVTVTVARARAWGTRGSRCVKINDRSVETLFLRPKIHTHL